MISNAGKSFLSFFFINREWQLRQLTKKYFHPLKKKSIHNLCHPLETSRFQQETRWLKKKYIYIYLLSGSSWVELYSECSKIFNFFFGNCFLEFESNKVSAIKQLRIQIHRCC